MKQITLKELREYKNMTQDQVAKNVKKTTRYISMIEQGLRNPSDKLKEELSKLYNVSITQIFLAIKTTKSSIKEKE